jgi:xanthine dehydrogenase accessory factor
MSLKLQVTQEAIIGAALNAVRQGVDAWLVTIVEITGSLPRPLGSMMVYSELATLGSVSGGCVEECLIERLQLGEFPAGTARLTKYGVDADDNERYGLPCGGKLTLLVEALGARDESWLQELHGDLVAREFAERAIQLEPYQCVISAATMSTLPAVDWQQTQGVHRLGPEHRLVLVGAAQLAETLSTLALQMEYQIVVLDPRPEKVHEWLGPEVSVQVLTNTEQLATYADSHTSLITLTHDRDIDDNALFAVANMPYAFIGALGSRRTSANRGSRLRSKGLSDEALARIHAPVGIDIGSKTPMEIAVSILAQLTQLKRGAMSQSDTVCLSVA